ncbi:hypothetical protein [Acanthamoeba castellanii mimivirus]|jgi:hypothetical protein|uniref:Uncharacterized protein n=4 Tax=Mimivirus TaxID=315393 RepID=E3VZR7_MIMIV|nr:hypothetical protein MIMI_gp0741 [Acanthamoeba polyphaga mimivirus]ADO18343.1 hypothetical protein [Acanthamoeba polyphaga mimivirus]UTE96776.1 hypothetical protein MIMI-R681 [Acanthamoeba polyphaga mimivirus]BAV61815.1 hypothetical protein [Acanthamoeba castellanii mimivirus]BAV62801.1 hypothetical protein [Acanthamoeba castellanii mimivirus]
MQSFNNVNNVINSNDVNDATNTQHMLRDIREMKQLVQDLKQVLQEIRLAGEDIDSTISLELLTKKLEGRMILDAFETMRFIGSRSGTYSHAYGGYYRDILAKKPIKDLDFAFSSEDDVRSFIFDLKSRYNVTLLKPSYTDLGCYSLKLEHKLLKKASILVDATYSCPAKRVVRFDFNVNMLLATHTPEEGSLDLKIRNSRCALTDVIDDCCHHKFVVLDESGSPKLTHQGAEIDRALNPDGSFKDLSDRAVFNSLCLRSYPDCINRRTTRGKKLLQRIEKMQSRGWTVRNEPCSNPFCIMAPTALFERCQEVIDQRREEAIQICQQAKEERIKRLEHRRATFETRKDKRLHDTFARSSYIPGYIHPKLANVKSHEVSAKSKQRELTKREIKKRVKQAMKLGETDARCSSLKSNKSPRSFRSNKFRKIDF